MYVCMHACMCGCMNVCVFDIYIRENLPAYAHTCIAESTCCLFTFKRAWRVYACEHGKTKYYICMYACMYVCMYIYIYIFIYLFTYIRMRLQPDSCTGLLVLVLVWCICEQRVLEWQRLPFKVVHAFMLVVVGARAGVEAVVTGSSRSSSREG